MSILPAESYSALGFLGAAEGAQSRARAALGSSTRIIAPVVPQRSGTHLGSHPALGKRTASPQLLALVTLCASLGASASHARGIGIGAAPFAPALPRSSRGLSGRSWRVRDRVPAPLQAAMAQSSNSRRRGSPPPPTPNTRARVVTAEIGAKLAGARPKSPISRAVLYYGRAALDLHGANFPDRRDLMKPPAKRALEAAEDPSRSGEERLASACERWAARVAVARRARMRWFIFSQLARTSLEWPWRAPKTSLGAVMSAVAIVGTSSIGPAPLAHRAATLVAHASTRIQAQYSTGTQVPSEEGLWEIQRDRNIS